MVLGTPTTLTPRSCSFCATESVSSPPMAIRASILFLLERGHAAIDAIGALGGIGARGAQDGAAARQNSADRVQIERHALVFDQAAPAFQKADEFVAIGEDALAHHGANHGIQARTIASAG